MLLKTTIYIFPTKELDLGINADDRTWELVPAILDMDEIAYCHQAGPSTFAPEIPNPTYITFKSGESFVIQIPYDKFADMWINYKKHE